MKKKNPLMTATRQLLMQDIRKYNVKASITNE